MNVLILRFHLRLFNQNLLDRDLGHNTFKMVSNYSSKANLT